MTSPRHLRPYGASSCMEMYTSLFLSGWSSLAISESSSWVDRIDPTKRKKVHQPALSISFSGLSALSTDFATYKWEFCSVWVVGTDGVGVINKIVEKKRKEKRKQTWCHALGWVDVKIQSDMFCVVSVQAPSVSTKCNHSVFMFVCGSIYLGESRGSQGKIRSSYISWISRCVLEWHSKIKLLQWGRIA